MSEDRIISSKEQNDDKQWDLNLRPQCLGDYVGQKQIKNNLDIVLEAAKKRKESIDHVLLYGPPGLGKTTLAHNIAKEIKQSQLTWLAYRKSHCSAVYASYDFGTMRLIETPACMVRLTKLRINELYSNFVETY